MAKSIRSKIHRKNRSHFRSTIGEEAAQVSFLRAHRLGYGYG